MAAHSVIIFEPRLPGLTWRRLAPRYLRYTAAIDSMDLAIAEAEWWWAELFGEPRSPRSILLWQAYDGHPKEITPRASGEELRQQIAIKREGIVSVSHSPLVLRSQGGRPPGGAPPAAGAREPRRPGPGSGSSGAARRRR